MRARAFGCAICAMLTTAAIACASHIDSSVPSPSTTLDASPTDEETSIDAACAVVAEGRVPLVHRAVAEVCRSTRAPDARPPIVGSTDSENQCNSDADCWLFPNGRCIPVRYYNQCTFDLCFDDAECSGKVCACDVPYALVGGESMPALNVCVAGNCRVDADCGLGGWCSPSWLPGRCGSRYIDGWFCHTSNDCCFDDGDCKDTLCGYDRVIGHWTCTKVGGCTG
jgi:hypothetical protein